MRKIIINKLIIITGFLLFLSSNFLWAQQITENKTNWYNLDLKEDSVFGISTEKAYIELLKQKVAVPIIVAIIDGGVDIDHEDLRLAIWNNPKEIARNHKDDDGDGYIDDINGWNFMGSSKGNFHLDNLELVRSLRKAIKDNPKSPDVKRLKALLTEKLVSIDLILHEKEIQRNALRNIIRIIGKEYPTLEEFKRYHYRTGDEARSLMLIVNGLKENADFINEFENKYQQYKNQKDYLYNIDYDPREGNREFQKKKYGNGDVKGIEPSHGTHIAGIIIANRENGIGIKGITDHAEIMCLTAIPEGDALDRDVASAILFAANHGARIINISSGKAISPDKKLVDDAVKYAMSKDILIIHAAGNKGENLEMESGFPSRNYLDGGQAKNWIEVGASGPIDDLSLLPWFSNYGIKAVDVFAPGVDLYSTYPNNKYAMESGTSMAAPVVSGIAALIWSYYPKFSAAQVKWVIMNSVVKPKHPVKNNLGNILDFSSLCLSGGIVNAFNALQLADKLYNKKE